MLRLRLLRLWMPPARLSASTDRQASRRLMIGWQAGAHTGRYLTQPHGVFMSTTASSTATNHQKLWDLIKDIRFGMYTHRLSLIHI